MDLTAALAGLRAWAWLVVPASLVLLAVSLAVLPWVLVRLPADYLLDPHARVRIYRGRHPLWARIGLAAQSLLGAVLLLAGLAMLFLPGQGMLAVLAGLLLLRFPGKRRLVRGLLARPAVRRPVNALRRGLGHAPLAPPPGRGPDRGGA